MAKPTSRRTIPGFNLGDRVKVKYSAGRLATIVELRGALGPKGCDIYRIAFDGDPEDTFVEVRDDQLIALEDPNE